MFAESYIDTATHIFNEFSLQQPLAVFLKKYFKANPKFGSRDRKFIAGLLYGAYRLGKGQSQLSVRNRLLVGSFLSGDLPVLFFEKTDRSLAEKYAESFEQKLEWVKQQYQVEIEIPFALSDSVTKEEYLRYLFQPSRVFIRIRKDKNGMINSLTKKQLPFELLTDSCMALPLNTKLAEILPQEDAYVIQDYASQLAGSFFKPAAHELWWDCCAASGGKSLLLLDKESKVDLTVSDIRPDIIENLRLRFQRYHYHKYKAVVLDASRETPSVRSFDHIIADVPCSGAGTWSRNPEQFYFFDESKLTHYTGLQHSILLNALTCLAPGGSLYYFTCSVFKNENEDIVNTLDSTEFSIVQQQMLKGFEFGGDCLFFCKIKKPA